MSSARKSLDFVFTTTNPQKVQDFLDENTKLDLTGLKDQKGSNILHQTAFQGRLVLMKIYLQHMRKFYQAEYWNSTSQYKKSVKLSIQSWINQTNNDGFTPIHYASYKGNVQMIKFLQNLGASIDLTTKVGLNVLHLAAQGDRITSMIHFYDRFDINCTDQKNGTPLHWACYMGSQQATAFLLAQPKIQIDLFDAQEQTPLHLATIYGNTKIVRRLLIKGADRTLRNGKGQKPIEIAKQNQFKNITKMLNEDYTCLDQFRFYYNIKMKYKPTDRSYSRLLLFLLAFIFTVATSHLFLQPNFNPYFLLIPAIFYLVFIVNYFSLLTTPKTIGIPKPYKMLMKSLPICADCQIPRKERSFHCDICKVCIAQYDHHCPWINNCVGKKNIGRFILFLIMLIITMLEVIAVSLAGILEYNQFVKEIRFSTTQLTSKLIKVVFGLDILICGLYIVPVLTLLYVQLNNLCLGLTTYERFSKHAFKTVATTTKESLASQTMDSTRERLLKSSTIDVRAASCSCSNCIVMCKSEPQVVQQDEL